MGVQECQFRPPRLGRLDINTAVTQADVDDLFASIDTSGWTMRPTWDPAGSVLRWRVNTAPWNPEVEYGDGSTVIVERPYNQGQPMLNQPDSQVQVYAYPPGAFDPASVIPI